MIKKLVSETHPTWIRNAVVYQIFPDRFRKSGQVENQETLKLQSWGSSPTSKGFQGGDLYGILNSLDYLQELGITCIYLNPIFLSTANHRYHTSDYLQVDPLLGGNKALEDLIFNLHQRGMKIILDGVFNHCGRGFWAFNDLLENGSFSPYLDWFKVKKWPLIPYPKPKQDCGYYCWWNDPALPKFNHNNSYVCNYLLEVATLWLDKGIDGWRLDVPEEIPSEFWIQFRTKVKEINPEAWILGEIWGDARPWLKGDQFDGVMNYRFAWSTLSWVGGSCLNKGYINPSYPIKELTSEEYISILKETIGWYGEEINSCQLNLLDSHDVPRALNTLNGDIPALKIALFLMFLQPGAPCIYYGTERELAGGEDPQCRESFPWDQLNNNSLTKYISSLSLLRKQIPNLQIKVMSWSTLGQDVIFGRLTLGKDNPIGKSKINVFVNRNRKDYFNIFETGISPLFSFGEIDLNKNLIGPQSGILFYD